MTDKIIVYSTAWCPDCRRAKKFLDDHGIAYEDIDVDRNPEAAEYVKRVNNGNRSVPTIVFPDGTILVEPRNFQLAKQLGVPMRVG